MITPEGLVKILDFGLAKHTSGTALTESASHPGVEPALATEPGRLLGTVAYMSPEQARGLPLDFRSDQFAFGVILFEMLAGRRPFAGATTLDTLAAILHAEPAGLADVETQLPAPLAWIVRRCLAKDPAARYAATRDLAQELDTIRDRMTDAGSLVGSGAIPAQGKRPLRRATLFAGIAGAAGIVGLLVVAGLRQARHLDNAAVAQSALTPATATAVRRIAVLPFRDLSGTATGARIGEGFAETVSVRLAAASGLAVLPAAALDTSPGGVRRPGRDGFPAGGHPPHGASRRCCAARSSSRAPRCAPPSRSWTRRGGRSRPARPRDPRRNCSRCRTRSPPSPLLPSGRRRRRSQAARLVRNRSLQKTGISKRLGHLRRYENEASVGAAIRILDALGDSPQVAAARARAYLAQYELTQQREWAEKAIAASRLATVEGSQEAGAYETLGRVQLLLGKPLAATRELERAVASQPNSVEARFALAAALDQLGRASEAEAALRGAVALQPGWWGTHSHLGMFLVTKGRFAESLPILREAIRLSPDNTRAIGNLAIAYQQLGRYEEALAEYRRSITIRPTPEALSNLATCEFVLGRYSEAAETYHRAIALQAGNGVLWRNLGDALRWTGGREAETRSAVLASDRPARSRRSR